MHAHSIVYVIPVKKIVLSNRLPSFHLIGPAFSIVSLIPLAMKNPAKPMHAGHGQPSAVIPISPPAMKDGSALFTATFFLLFFTVFTDSINIKLEMAHISFN